MNMTVADVSKVLASVANICECGNSVVFDEDGSYLEDKRSNKRTAMHKRDGVYVMDIRVSQDRRRGVENLDSDQVPFRGLGPDLL